MYNIRICPWGVGGDREPPSPPEKKDKKCGT